VLEFLTQKQHREPNVSQRSRPRLVREDEGNRIGNRSIHEAARDHWAHGRVRSRNPEGRLYWARLVHIDRVRNLAVKLAKSEGADPFVVELAALLHDIADWKFNGGDITAGATKSRQWLTSLGVDEATQSRVAQIILAVSFKGAGVKNEIDSLEGQVVQDADRLDALGAIGIARTFAYGGHFNRVIYDPSEKPIQHETFEQYKSSKGTTINHFYENCFCSKTD